MRRVVYSLVPLFLWSVYLFGWRVVALTAFVALLGILTEYVGERQKNKKVTEAALVTSALFALSLPPAVPFWVAGVGIIFAILFGKEAYGGFGRNVYNPAITGRTFAYISFPLMMQTTWMLPTSFGTLGVNRLIPGNTIYEAIFMLVLVSIAFLVITRTQGKLKSAFITASIAILITVAFYVTMAYSFPFVKGHGNGLSEVDVVAMATPIEVFRGLAVQNNWHQTVSLFGIPIQLDQNNPLALFFGIRVGAMGEGSIFLIILAAIYLLWTKTANWRPMLWTFLSALVFTAIFYFTGLMDSRFPLFAATRLHSDLSAQIIDILSFLMAGSLIYAAVFMSTDPVTSPRKAWSMFAYGTVIGGVTIVIRVFAGFPEGVSFAILAANTFASIFDEILPGGKKKGKKKIVPAAEGAAS